MKRWLLAILLASYCVTLAVPQTLPEPSRTADTASKCLAWVIHSEARGEPLRGARGVLDAVLKRMKVRNQEACEVVAAKKQFSGCRPGVFEDVTEDMMVRYRLVTTLPPVVPNCDYFHATYVAPQWANGMRRCKKVGNHIFYSSTKSKTTKEK